jgi:hypothetical protein
MAFSFCSNSAFSKNDSTLVMRDDTVKGGAGTILDLAKDEGIKCSRMELTEIEFRATCADKYGELLRITYQDLERGGREIIFQKKMLEKDEVKFFIPFDFVKEAKTSVLIIMKGSGMFYKKIDITD